MSRFMSRLLNSFGDLLNVAPRGGTCSRKRVIEIQKKLSTRSDADSIASCFKNVGNDIAFSMKKYQDGKK